MVLVDYREETKTKKAKNLDLLPHFERMKLKAEKANLEFGDACFEGNGPDGSVLVGIERKGLHDLINCIEDARLSGHQLIGMRDMYAVRILMVEAHWKPHDDSGILMEGFSGGTAWGYYGGRNAQRTMYSKVKRYLQSVSLSGTIVDYSRDPFHTAYNIGEWFHYFQKKWSGHTSLLEMQKVAIPALTGKPSLVRKWAVDLDDIGVKLSEDAEKLFKTPIALATADETDWLKLRGVGVPTAQKIIRQIWGRK